MRPYRVFRRYGGLAVLVLAVSLPGCRSARGKRGGAAPLLTRIELQGYAALSASDIRAVIQSKEREVVSARKLKLDAVGILNLYHAKGFVEARVKKRVSRSEDGKNAAAHFEIIEGSQYTLRRVVINGAEEIDHEDLVGVVALEEEKPIDFVAFRRGAAAIVRQYGDAGFLDVDVQCSLVPVTGQEHVVDGQYTIQEGPRSVLEEVQLEWNGEQITQERVIREAITLEPGSPISLGRVLLEVAGLRARRWFKKIEYRVDDGSAPGKKILVLILTEGRSARLHIGGGASSSGGASGSLSLTEHNFDFRRYPHSWEDLTSGRAFRGAGEFLSIGVAPGDDAGYAAFVHRKPWVFGTDWTLTTSGAATYRIWDRYDKLEARLEAGVSKEIAANTRLSAGFYGKWVGISDVAWWTAPELREVEGKHWLYGPRARVTYDTRDSRVIPTAGHVVTFSATGSFEGESFLKLSGDARLFLRVHGQGPEAHTFMLRGAFGSIVGNAPIFERFRAGGMDTIRGFEYGHVGPHSDWDDRVSLGGQFRALASLEYSFPVWQSGGLRVRAVGFVDSGSVGEIEELSQWRVSAGAGIRVAHERFGGTFFGMDFAGAVHREDEDREQVLSFFLAPRF